MVKWFFAVLFLVSACNSSSGKLEDYYSVSGVSLRIPTEYSPSYEPVCASRYCDEEKYGDISKPTGLSVRGILFQMHDYETLKRTIGSIQQKGLSDLVTIRIIDKNFLQKKNPFPNRKSVWETKNRTPEKDIGDLRAYGSVEKDDVNYKFEPSDAPPVFIICQFFSLPNPKCRVSSHWRGLVLYYDFNHRHFDDWKNTHGRIIALLESFIY